MPEEYTGGLGAAGAEALRAFVEAGGTLVALDSASGYAIDALGLKVKDALAGVDAKSFYCPGSILRASVDTAKPLAHGLALTLPLWFEGSPAFEVEKGTSWRVTTTRIRCCRGGCSAASSCGAGPRSSRRRSGRVGWCCSASAPVPAQSRVSYVALLSPLCRTPLRAGPYLASASRTRSSGIASTLRPSPTRWSLAAGR